ncbi:MAG: tetratricopeptide repeat protein, partial [Patescibacteria group bacterium]|nr:tetratricopeptide repeat protein [Patescibacteria group bacterium]
SVTNEDYKEKISFMWVWFEKLLRKTRIRFLKIDNKIIFLLDKLREKNVEIEVDKNEKNNNISEYKNIDEEKEITKTENDTNWRENTVYTENKSLESEKKVSEDIDNNMEEEVVDTNDNKVVETISNKSLKDADNMEAEIVNSEILKDTDDNKAIETINNEDEKSDEILESKEETKEDTEAYAKRDNAKGKEKEYIEMIIKNPIDIKSYWKLGIVYSRRKNYKDAISCFRQITKIDPTYTKAKKKISDLVERMKDKKDNRKKKKKKKIAKESTKDQKKEE